MATSCENCGTRTEATFCPACGQPVASIDMPAGEFAREIAGEVLALDSRARQTLGPLFLRPGAVAQAYVAGQRARFVPPIRLYVFASFAMFLILSFGSGIQVDNVMVGGEPLDLDSIGAAAAAATGTPSDADVGEGAGDADAFEERLEDRFILGFQRITSDLESFSRTFMNRMAQVMFLLLPVFAAILKVFYRRRLYVHHAVFAIYLHCFVFLLVALLAIPDAVGLEQISAWTDTGLLAIPIYALLAMKRFYGEGWVRTVLKWGLVSMAYGMLGGVTLVALFVFSVLTI